MDDSRTGTAGLGDADKAHDSLAKDGGKAASGAATGVCRRADNLKTKTLARQLLGDRRCFFFFHRGHESSAPLERRRWQRACVDMCGACVCVRARVKVDHPALCPLAAAYQPCFAAERISGVKFHQIPKQECERRRVEEEEAQEGVSSQSASQHLATHRALSPLLFSGMEVVGSEGSGCEKGGNCLQEEDEEEQKGSNGDKRAVNGGVVNATGDGLARVGGVT